jgi:hypothetical protein
MWVYIKQEDHAYDFLYIETEWSFQNTSPCHNGGLSPKKLTVRAKVYNSRNHFVAWQDCTTLGAHFVAFPKCYSALVFLDLISLKYLNNMF